MFQLIRFVAVWARIRSMAGPYSAVRAAPTQTINEPCRCMPGQRARTAASLGTRPVEFGLHEPGSAQARGDELCSPQVVGPGRFCVVGVGGDPSRGGCGNVRCKEAKEVSGMGLFGGKRSRGDRVAEAGEAFAAGQREFAAERFGAAVPHFRTAASLTPDSPNSQFMLGVSLFQAGKLKQALEPLRRCIALKSDHDDAHFILGVALGRMDRFGEAETHLARAAWLGNGQARERLPKVGADYCRRCGASVQVASGDGEGADVRVLTLDIGIRCTDCHTVLCTGCAGIGPGVQTPRSCPDCGGRLRPLTR